MKKKELNKILKKIEKEGEGKPWFYTFNKLTILGIRLLNELLEKIK